MRLRFAVPCLLGLALLLDGCRSVSALKDAYRIDPLFMPVTAPLVPVASSSGEDTGTRGPRAGDPTEKRQCGFWLWSMFNWECRLSPAQKKFRDTYGIPLINLNTYRFAGADTTAYEQAQPPVEVPLDEPARTAALEPSLRARNRLARQLMTLSDELCAKHEADIMAQSAATNVILGTATSVFAGAGAIVGGIAAQALSGGGAFTNATRATINEEIYAKHFAPSIVRSIHADRPPKGAGIERRLAIDSPLAYPIDLALKEVNDYHQACSFHNAIVRVSSATERTMPTETDILMRITELQRLLASETPRRDTAYLAWAQADKTSPESRQKLLVEYEEREKLVRVLTNQLHTAYVQLSLIQPGGTLSVPATPPGQPREPQKPK